MRDNAKLYARYMDDILRSIKRAEVQRKLAEINRYHPFLKFTIEEENEQFSLSFLDMLMQAWDITALNYVHESH